MEFGNIHKLKSGVKTTKLPAIINEINAAVCSIVGAFELAMIISKAMDSMEGRPINMPTNPVSHMALIFPIETGKVFEIFSINLDVLFLSIKLKLSLVFFLPITIQ